MAKFHSISVFYFSFFITISAVSVWLWGQENVIGTRQLHPLITPIFIVFMGVAMAGLFLRVLSIFRHVSFSPKTLTNYESWPPVSIVRPINGTDPYLGERLETMFNLNYPGKFEIIFCLDDKNDQAIPVIQQLRQKYSQVDSRISIEPNIKVLNPCMRNIEQGIRYSKYPNGLVWVCASRIICQTDQMKDMVARCCNNKGLVMQHYYVKAKSTSFASHVERIYFASSFSSLVPALEMLSAPTACGASFIFPHSFLDKLGGCETIGKYLAEDFIIGSTCEDLGLNIDFSYFPVLQDNSRCLTMKLFNERQIRWAKIRICVLPVLFTLLEKLSLPVMNSGLFALPASYLFGIPPTICYFPFLLLLFIQDLIIVHMVDYKYNRLENFPNPFTYFCYWTLVQLLQLVLLIVAFKNSSRIRWGDKVYSVADKTLIKHVDYFIKQ